MGMPEILFVDDEEPILRAIRRDLKGEPYVIHTTPSPEEALKILEREKISVIVSDHRMPKMTGIEMLIEAKQHYPDIVRVVLSGQADLPMVIKAINQGSVFQFLTKPWEQQELRDAIRGIVQHVQTVERLKNEVAALPGGVTPETMSVLERSHPGISQLRRTSTGAIEIDPNDPSLAMLDLIRPGAEPEAI
jgi:DNA-binding NtrC family response regulator